MRGGSQPLIIGRDGPRAAVAAAVGRALDGAPQIVLVDGAPGCGRSALALACAADAARAGCTTATVAMLPGDDAAVHAVLARARPAGSSAGLVVVDDAHLADEAALRTVVRAALAPHEIPLVLVLSAVPGQAPVPVAAALDEVRARADTVLVTVGPLDEDDAAELVRARAPAATPEQVRTCVRRAAGIPALLAPLAAEVADGTAGPATHVPDRVRAFVAARLARLGPDCAAMALAVHVLGDGALLRDAATLAGLDLGSATTAADALVRDGLLQDTPQPAFAAPLLGSAVGRGVTRFALAQHHRRAAALLREQHRPVREVAAQLMPATPAGEAWAVGVLVEDARRHAAEGRLAAASATLGRALEEPPSAADLPHVAADLAVVRSRLGAADAGEALSAALQTAHSPDARVRVLREIARFQWLDGQMPEAFGTAQQALAAADPESASHEDVATELVAIASSHDVAVLQRDPTFAELLERARRGWVPQAPGLAVALAFALPLLLADHRLVPRLVDHAMDGHLWDPDATPFGLRGNFALTTLHWADELERASMALARAAVDVDDDPARRSAMGHWETESLYASGRLQDACAAGGQVLGDAGGASPWWVPFTAATVAQAELDRGDRLAADAALRVAEQTFDPGHLSGLGARLARARWHLEGGDPVTAAAVVRDVASGAATIGHRDGPAIAWRPLAVAAAVASGEQEQAIALAQEEVRLARTSSARARLAHALCARSTTASDADALDDLEEAVALQETTGRAVELARALVALGEERRRREDVEGARVAASRAREIASDHGAGPLAAAALACLHATGARPRRVVSSGPAALTSAERRVVERAARGMTNREIADELVLAARTVEWHLGRAYAKLGVRSRRDLPGALGSTPV